jgi:hypothetical protein
MPLTNGIVDGLAAMRKGFTIEEKKQYDDTYDCIFNNNKKKPQDNETFSEKI